MTTLSSKKHLLSFENNLVVNGKNITKVYYENGEFCSNYKKNNLILINLVDNKINLCQRMIFYSNEPMIWRSEDKNYFYGIQKIGFFLPEILFAVNKELLKFKPNLRGFYFNVKIRLKKNNIQESKKVNQQKKIKK